MRGRKSGREREIERKGGNRRRKEGEREKYTNCTPAAGTAQGRTLSQQPHLPQQGVRARHPGKGAENRISSRWASQVAEVCRLLGRVAGSPESAMDTMGQLTHSFTARHGMYIACLNSCTCSTLQSPCIVCMVHHTCPSLYSGSLNGWLKVVKHCSIIPTKSYIYTNQVWILA